jgi:HD superfamily phosphohydrolase/uncharacterized protein YjbK
MIIKDIVYGDIEIPEKFKAIIDTPEFQRLRRIKQLATANLVFPAANHTRFEHSIGTYHVMKKLVDHFIEYFHELDKNIVFEENDIDAVLMAALLHDIGHGPFSHAFEQALEYKFDHETMTCRIIADTETEVNKKLKYYFGDNFPEKVVNYINVRNEYKGNPQTGEENNRFGKSFQWIFRQLVSSQLDADRMDYILRDAKEVGVPFGSFSINDLIAGMQVTFFENGYYVSILEKYLNYVEGYLYARYQMYRNIYMDSYKIFSEELLKKIIQRVKDLYLNGIFSNDRLSVYFKLLTNKYDLTIPDFCRLDDHVVMGTILDQSLGHDKILSILCKSFLNRTGFEKLVLLSNNEDDVLLFKQEFLSLFHKYLTIPHDENTDIFSLFYFWVENVRRFSVYDKNSARIYIQCNNGLIKDLAEVSSFISDKNESASAYYLNFDLLHIFFDENKLNKDADFETFISELERLIDCFNPRKQLEIEKKYIVALDDENIFNDVFEFIKSSGEYLVGEPINFFQKDEYYDYNDFRLNKENKSIRMRSKDGEYVVTYKKAIEGFDSMRNANQTIRIEKEVRAGTSDILSCFDIVKNSITDLKPIFSQQLINILTITNDRTKCIFSKGKFVLEIVFDDISYCFGENEKYHEKQIEIELKSNYEYRINLNLFTDSLESFFKERIIPNFQSKLDRGLSLINTPIGGAGT